MLAKQKIIGADLAHIIEGDYASTFIIPLGLATERPDLAALQEGEQVLLDEGDATAEGIVYSEWHDGQRYWFARVDGTTWRNQE